MDYSREAEAPVYYIDDITSDDERSAPELYTSSSAACSSVNTLTSSEVHGEYYFQEAHGRKFPADVNVALSLPTDSIEATHWMGAHQILKAFFGSLFWGPADQVLAMTPGQRERKQVLDMVTAEGSWVQEMSLQFPHVDFMSLDNVPLIAHIPRPNVDFQVYDLYNGIAAPDETFDVVHMRYTMIHLTNPHDVLREVYRVLKPGGLFLFHETEIGIFDGLNPERAMSEVLPSWCEGFDIWRDALSRQGVVVDMGHEMARWLAPNSDIWTSVKPKEPGKLVGFRNIEYKYHLLPVGPWPEDARLKMIGRAGGRGWENVWRGLGAMLRMYGHDEANAKRIVQGGVEDINRPGVPIATRLHTAYAFKI